MTKTLIISNGPSAKNLSVGLARYGYDVVIGVNWTCLTYPCDWICVHDGPCFGAEDQEGATPPRLCTPKGIKPCFGKWLAPGRNGTLAPKWFVHWHALDWLRANRSDIAELLSHEYVMTWPAKCPEVPYSGVAPLHLMRILGLSKADAIGYDMDGDDDHAGGTSVSRNPSRWERERELFERLCREWHLTLNMINQ